jgi:adenylate cyclase
MAQEIERKFLLRGDGWRARVTGSLPMKQGYLASHQACSVRVRIAGGQAFLNLKSATLGVERYEYEYEIPVTDAEEILHTLCERPFIDKVRHHVPYAGHLWEVDEFEGENAGLVVAEIELGHPDEPFARPEWLGAEVSHDPRYYNVCLLKHPYSRW